MSYINEEVEFGTLETTARIIVLEKTKEECVAPWFICNLEIDGYGRMSPKELRQLGRWLINEGKRIGREYKSNGAKK